MGQTHSIPLDLRWATFLKTERNLPPPPRPEEKSFIFFYNVSWPQYKFPEEEVWPLHGTLPYNTIFQLDLFCWLEVSYVQAFMTLSQKFHPPQKL